MKLWLSKNSEVPVRAQIVAQVRLGIASGDLEPGEKLPSTREIARRFKIHQNTVSAAYRELAASELVEFKKGSGVFISERASSASFENALDSLVSRFFKDAELLGFTHVEVANRIAEKFKGKGTSGFLVIEPNPALREIIIDEISEASPLPVRGISPEELSTARLGGLRIVALFDEAERLAKLLPPETVCTYLRANSVAGSLDGRQRPDGFDLIAVASGWEDFLTFARLMLLAARIDSESIILCSTGSGGWKRRLAAASTIICDSVTARELAGDDRLQVFRLISDSSLGELRATASAAA